MHSSFSRRSIQLQSCNFVYSDDPLTYGDGGKSVSEEDCKSLPNYMETNVFNTEHINAPYGCHYNTKNKKHMFNRSDLEIPCTPTKKCVRKFKHHKIPKKTLVDKGGNPNTSEYVVEGEKTDLKRGEYNGSDRTTLKACEEKARKADVEYFAWTGSIYNGYCKVLKPSVSNPDLTTYQGYGYKRYKRSKLKECEGDCDNDDHCAGELKCFQRYGYTGVPGCSGRGVRSHDYCYMPEQPPLVSRGGQPQTQAGFENNKLKECEGDCDSDDHCEGDLKCFQRNRKEKVPGCRKGGSGDKWGHDYCYDDRRLGTLSLTEKQCKSIAGPRYDQTASWNDYPAGCIYQPKKNKYYYNKNANSKVECTGESQCIGGMTTCFTQAQKKELKDKVQSNPQSCETCLAFMTVLEPTIVILYKVYVERAGTLIDTVSSQLSGILTKIIKGGLEKKLMNELNVIFEDIFGKFGNEDKETKQVLNPLIKEYFNIDVNIDEFFDEAKKVVLGNLQGCIQGMLKELNEKRKKFIAKPSRWVKWFAHSMIRCYLIAITRYIVQKLTHCNDKPKCMPKLQAFYFIEDKLTEFTDNLVLVYDTYQKERTFRQENSGLQGEREAATEDATVEVGFQVGDFLLNASTGGRSGRTGFSLRDLFGNK